MLEHFNEEIDRWKRWLSLAIIFLVGNVDEKMDRMKRDSRIDRAIFLARDFTMTKGTREVIHFKEMTSS